MPFPFLGLRLEFRFGPVNIPRGNLVIRSGGVTRSAVTSFVFEDGGAQGLTPTMNLGDEKISLNARRRAFRSVLAALLATLVACDGSERGRLLRRETLGNQWPLTVDSIRVDCLGGVDAVGYIGSATYALNGMARQRARYRELDSIWRPNPDVPELRVSIKPLIDSALQFCK
jgi:hypothetical protein